MIIYDGCCHLTIQSSTTGHFMSFGVYVNSILTAKRIKKQTGIQTEGFISEEDLTVTFTSLIPLIPIFSNRRDHIYLRWVISQVQKEADIVHWAIFFKVRFEEPGCFHVYLNINNFISAGRRKILIICFWWRQSYKSKLFLLLKIQASIFIPF